MFKMSPKLRKFAKSGHTVDNPLFNQFECRRPSESAF